MQKKEIESEVVMKVPQVMIDFSEVRRLNRDIILNEYLMITDFDQTVKLYSQLEDKRFSRSEPIPALFEKDFFLMLKPKMKKELYGDIEVTKMEIKNSVLNVYYKEITNEEYLSEKQKNPILILRVNGEIPSSIKLMNITE
ncbi:hypothetical protein [Chryseobacterium aquaeductus]|nr:hypothetical protein [Chryseobacterium aquaeductus]